VRARWPTAEGVVVRRAPGLTPTGRAGVLPISQMTTIGTTFIASVSAIAVAIAAVAVVTATRAPRGS